MKFIRKTDPKSETGYTRASMINLDRCNSIDFIKRTDTQFTIWFRGPNVDWNYDSEADWMRDREKIERLINPITMDEIEMVDTSLEP